MSTCQGKRQGDDSTDLPGDWLVRRLGAAPASSSRYGGLLYNFPADDFGRDKRVLDNQAYAFAAPVSAPRTPRVPAKIYMIILCDIQKFG